MRDLLDDFHEPLLDRWRPARAFHLRDGCDFHEVAHEIGRSPHPVQWRFQLRRSTLIPDLFGFFWHIKAFDALIVHSGLLEGEGLALSVSLHDLKGTWVAHPPVALDRAGGPLELELRHFVSPNGQEPFRFPLKAILLRCVGAQIGKPYTVGLTRLELRVPEEAPAAIGCAEVATAGEPLPIALACTDPERVQLLLLGADGAIVADCVHDGRRALLSASLAAGRYVLEAWRHGRRLARSPEISVRPGATTGVRADIGMHRGAPALLLDHVPNDGLAYATYNPRREFARHFRDAQVRIVSVPTTSNHHVFDLAPTVTPEPGSYDARYLDLTIRTVLDADPDLLLLPRVYLGSAPWWDRSHPDEIGAADDAQGRTSPLCMTFIDTRLSKPSPSFSSPRWQRAALDDLRRHLEHLASAPYASQIIGVLVTSGGSEEWFHWYDEEQQELWGDVGPRHQEAFARWALARYGSSAAVERAWGRPLAASPIPERSRREQSAYRLLRDPVREQDVIDFYRFHSDVIADFLLESARVVKDVSRGRWLVGAFYGYLFHFTGACRHLNGGHLALRRVLQANVLDFLCAPTGYGHREPGDGVSAFMVPTGSVRLRGKLYYDENDLRTHVVPAPGGMFDREFCRKEWGVTDDLHESIQNQRRELGHVIEKACPLWWFDLYPFGLYHEPAMRAEIAREVEVAKVAFTLDRESAAQVAVLIDEESCLHERPEGSLFWHSVSLAREPLARMGAPFLTYLLEDLPELPPHDLYIFLNAWAPSARVRAEVRRLELAKRHLLFCGPAGLYRDGRLDWDGPSDLIGMPVDVKHAEGVLAAVIEGGGRLHALAGTSFGPGAFPPPYVVPRAGGGAMIEARSAGGEPQLAVLDRGGALTWFCAPPGPPSEVLTGILRACGMHVYCDSGDPTHASRNLISIHGRSTGRKTIHLPAPSALTDVFTGALCSPRAERHEIALAKGETRLFFLGPPDAWQQLRERALGARNER